MTFPSFYNPDRVGTLYVPQTLTAVSAGQATQLPPASGDKRRVLLLLVDTQVDFVHEDGSLAVPGAVEDARRTIEWLYRNMAAVTTIAASLDSHTPQQIFYPTWWIDDNGQHPDPYTPITTEDVATGRWQPVQEKAWSVEYVKKLEVQAKKVLMIWPYHTMIGTPGHSITPALYEAMAYHSGARNAQPILLSKGGIPKTEHYSIFEPEVKVENAPLGKLNTTMLNVMTTYDLVYIAGQAKSHCVLETINTMMHYYGQNLPDMIGRLRLLTDCTSSVQHPEIDFESIANGALDRFAEQGLTRVLSTEAIE